MLNSLASRKRDQLSTFLTFLAIGFSLNIGSHRAWAVSPTAAGLLSVVPGLGEAVEGRPLIGLGYLAGVAGLFLASNLTSGDARIFFGAAGPSLYCYQMYAAYRDGEPENRMYGRTNVFEDYAAAFNPMNVLDPKVIGFDAIAAYQGATHGQGGSYSPLELIYFGLAVQQEEALYRGFLYPVFTDLYGGFKIGAALTTSLLDAAQHGLYLADAFNPVVFTVRTVLFLYLTWVYENNNYFLPKNIFAHAWFDYLLRSKISGASFAGGRPFDLNGSVDGFVAGVKFHF